MSQSAPQRFFSAVAYLSFGRTALSQASSQKTAAAFESALIKTSAQLYLSGSLFASAAFSLLSFAFLYAALSLPLPESFALFLIAAAGAFSLFLAAPKVAAWKANEQIESELPFMLREFSVYLDIGLPFEKALGKISSQRYLISSRFARAQREIRSGSTVQSALALLSAGTESVAAKRCILMLSSIYETGATTEPLKRTAEELSFSLLAQMRTQSSRLSLLAILFIATSALLPSFFAVFASVAPLLGSSEVTAWQVWLAFILAFPVLNALSLALMLLFFPSGPQHDGGGDDLMPEFLQKHGFNHGRTAFILAISAIALAVSLPLFLSGQFMLSALALCIAPAIYFWASYAAYSPVQSAEERLPDALYSASSVHRLLSAEKMLLVLSKGGFGRLSEAFGLALRRQHAGEAFGDSLAAAARFCPSPLVSRAFGLLAVAYETGANMHTALRESAQDVASFFSLVRERSALLSIQRYTVLAASALLVPFILGTVVSIVPSFASATTGANTAFAAEQTPSELFSTIIIACQVYLVINSLLSSLLLAFAETNPKKAALYFPLIAPLSQVAFAFASQGGLSLLAS